MVQRRCFYIPGVVCGIDAVGELVAHAISDHGMGSDPVPVWRSKTLHAVP